MKGGKYDLTKLDDCVRLVADSRPDRQRQETMLAVIERTPGTPTRAQIIEAMKRERK